MAKKLTDKQIEARALAFHEAADHLTMDWTDDQEEYEQGLIVSARLAKMAIRLYTSTVSKEATS